MESMNCPDCGVPVGELHEDSCDVERCPDCGGQLMSCDCEKLTYPRIAWDGNWPGVEQCLEFDWFSKFVAGKGWISCDKSDPEARPDLNRLMQETVWNPELQKRVIR